MSQEDQTRTDSEIKDDVSPDTAEAGTENPREPNSISTIPAVNPSTNEMVKSYFRERYGQLLAEGRHIDAGKTAETAELVKKLEDARNSIDKAREGIPKAKEGIANAHTKIAEMHANVLANQKKRADKAAEKAAKKAKKKDKDSSIEPVPDEPSDSAGEVAPGEESPAESPDAAGEVAPGEESPAESSDSAEA
ncbi:MAG: hypothetical protein ACOYIK_08000 [Coriobacteriales bacterium]|jgi:hypothetical protein